MLTIWRCWLYDDDDNDDEDDDDGFDYDDLDVNINDHDEDIELKIASIPSVSINFAKRYGRKDGGQMDRRMDALTDKTEYRGAKPHLEIIKKNHKQTGV